MAEARLNVFLRQARYVRGGRVLLVWTKLAIFNDVEIGDETKLQTFKGTPWNVIK